MCFEPVPQPRRGYWRAGFWLGLAGAGLGFSAALIPLAQYTCAMLLWADSPLSVQPRQDDGLPVPAALAWRPLMYRVLTAVGGMPLAAALGLYIAVAGGGAYVLLRTINPTFRITTGVDWNRAILFRTYMHTAPLIKVLVTIVPALVATFLVWSGVASLASGAQTAPMVAALLSGAAVWWALSRDGVVGDCDSGNYALPSLRQSAHLALNGVAFAMLVWVAVYGLLGAPPEDLIRLARSLGGVGEQAWLPVAALWLGSSALAGAGVALGAGALGWPGAPMRARLGSLGCALIMTLSVALGLRSGLPVYARVRYDVVFPEGKASEPTWWRSGSGPRDVVWIAATLPGAGSWRSVSVVGVSGVPLTRGSLERVGHFMAQRSFRTALAGPGMTALYDGACREMAVGRRLQVGRDAARRLGEPNVVRLLMEDLWAVGATYEGRHALAALEDSALVVYPTDDSHLMAGDICARSGEVAGAKRWYGMAGLPPGRADERASRLYRFTGGTVRGRLSGVPPVWEAKVGIMPARSPLSGVTRSAASDSIAPFMMRDIIASAAVAKDGRFRMEGVGAGEYIPVVWLRTDTGDRRPDLLIRTDPGTSAEVRISADSPVCDVGEWRLEPAQSADR